MIKPDISFTLRDESSQLTSILIIGLRGLNLDT
jgi:hypothetical protein